MIHLSVPSLYAGVYGMGMLLEIGQRYHPELRRWSLVEEDREGTRVLEDKQSQETVQIPQYNFALFPGGNPVVVPYDIISVIAPPNPRIRVPKIDTLEQKSDFSMRVNTLLADNIGAKIVVDGPRHEYVYLDYPLEYIHLPRWFTTREGHFTGGERGRVRLTEGDTLFSYTYPREIDNKAAPSSGDIDYIPTSVTSELTDVPAVGMLDLTTPVERRDWTQIWPSGRNGWEWEPMIPLVDYAKIKGMEYYKAEYLYRRGAFDGARVNGTTGKIEVPQRLVTEGKK